ncbi:amino acid permease-domain-containing protein [Flammula alnicola]|nr:amino acid permease-domain-containing protein [Flammula alnicola]
MNSDGLQLQERPPSTRSSILKEESTSEAYSKDLPKPNGIPEKKLGFWKRLDAEDGNETRRATQSRHLVMIAIGGTIGTGIFLSAGSAVALAGPGSALLSYFVVGLFVYTVVITLGKISSMYPVSGAFSVFGTRLVSPALGFTLGMQSFICTSCDRLSLILLGLNYWLQWTLSIPSELTAAAVILQFWTQTLQTWHWVLIIIVPIFALQLIHVKVYGEYEYWFAMIKVVMIIFLFIVGLMFDWTGGKGHPGRGLSNFHDGQAFIGGFAAFA